MKEDKKLGMVNVYDINETLLWDGMAGDNPYQYLSWAEFLQGSIDATMMNLSQILTP